MNYARTLVLSTVLALLMPWGSAEADQGYAEKIVALENAVNHIAAAFPTRYSATSYRAELEELRLLLLRRNGGPRKLNAKGREEFEGRLETLARKALIAHPLLCAQPLLFVARKQYQPDHHNTATLFQVGEINEAGFRGGSALRLIDFSRGGEIRTVLDSPDGVIRDAEVHFSGERVLFSMRAHAKDSYHVYEISADGSGLEALTRLDMVSDVDPVYLPNGDIVFSSTREPKFCMCNRHIMANLYRMRGDGGNIRQIGKSTLFEGHASLLPDGRLLYDRWEYVDRNFGDAQGLWSAYPDGTAHTLFWGNNTNSPGGVIDARAIPGVPWIICTFTSCHDRPWGGIALVDRRLGMDGKDPVLRTWPADAVNLIGKGDFDTFTKVRPKYEDPYPLSENFFLCSRMTGDGERMGIYLLDTFGNEVLLHEEEMGCFDPMPLAPRPIPPVIPERADLAAKEGRFYVANVYEGTHMDGVEAGAVKWLRVVETPEKRSFNPEDSWGGQGRQNPAMNWHDFNNKRILGTVPVEEDGSAYFTVPADRFVYFQLLDEQGMMVQSMRSGVIARPGEEASCTGCHENRRTAPSVALSSTQALKRPPSALQDWHGPERLFSFTAEVQPVLDKHCVGCHDYGKRAGDTLNLSGDRTLTFNTAYNELWRKGHIAPIGAGPYQTQQAQGWGSHASALVKNILEGHHDVELDPESFDRLVTWIDLNAPYYPYYETAYPLTLAGRAPIDNGRLKQLSKLTGVAFRDLASHSANKGPQVNFERPELSPCLEKLQGKTAHGEALEIIKTGQRALGEQPRADMPGFQMNPEDRRRNERYAVLKNEEALRRASHRQGAVTYDP
jgi:hypothetical protein